MSGNIPHPHTEDLQTARTQAMIDQGHAIKEAARDVVEAALQLSRQERNPGVRAEIEQGTTHQELWDKYSKGVQTERPVQRSLSVAQSALRDGQKPETVVDILSRDPHYQTIQQQHGDEKARGYAHTMTRSAADREQKTHQGQPVQTRQISRTPSRQIGIHR